MSEAYDDLNSPLYETRLKHLETVAELMAAGVINNDQFGLAFQLMMQNLGNPAPEIEEAFQLLMKAVITKLFVRTQEEVGREN